MVLCCRLKFCGCNIQESLQLFFWFAMIIGILSPISIYFYIRDFFDIWPVIQRFFILFTVNSSWLMLISPIGYFLLQGKVSNKAIIAAYSVCLCVVIIAAMVCIAFSQAQGSSLDDMDTSFVLSIRDYFDEYGSIPEWLHELQARQKCCGFSGPEDWRKLIYPPDKPAIEDVPESCCVRKLVGCNLVMDSFHNKSDLGHWIFTDGCRKLIDKRLNSMLDCVAYGCIVIMMTGILLVTIYWCQLTTLMRQSESSFGGDSTKVPFDTGQGNEITLQDNLEDEGGSENVTPGPGSGFNSRRASLMAMRTVQFEPPGRLALTKTKSATNTNNNKNGVNKNIPTKSPPLPEPPVIPDDLDDEDDPGDRLNVRKVRSTSRPPSRRNSVGKVNKKRSKSLVKDTKLKQ